MSRSRVHGLYLASPGQPITGLSDTDVEAQFADPQIAHNILGLISLRHFSSENRPEFYFKCLRSFMISYIVT